MLIVRRLRRQENKNNLAPPFNLMPKPLIIQTAKSFHRWIHLINNLIKRQKYTFRRIGILTITATLIWIYYRMPNHSSKHQITRQTITAGKSLWRTLAIICNTQTTLRWTPQQWIPFIIRRIQSLRKITIGRLVLKRPRASTRIPRYRLKIRVTCRIFWETALT